MIQRISNASQTMACIMCLIAHQGIFRLLSITIIRIIFNFRLNRILNAGCVVCVYTVNEYAIMICTSAPTHRCVVLK